MGVGYVQTQVHQQPSLLLLMEEAPEHLSQLSDIAIYCHEPLWTVDNRKDTEKDYIKWLNGKKAQMRTGDNFHNNH